MQPLTFFKLLADSTRLQTVLLILQQQELCVCELTCALNETQPKISRHLAMLRKAELLLDRRQGQWVYYRINPALPAWAHTTLSQTLAENSTLLQQAEQQLNTMGERPQRLASCCN